MKKTTYIMMGMLVATVCLIVGELLFGPPKVMSAYLR